MADAEEDELLMLSDSENGGANKAERDMPSVMPRGVPDFIATGSQVLPGVVPQNILLRGVSAVSIGDPEENEMSAPEISPFSTRNRSRSSAKHFPDIEALKDRRSEQKKDSIPESNEMNFEKKKEEMEQEIDRVRQSLDDIRVANDRLSNQLLNMSNMLTDSFMLKVQELKNATKQIQNGIQAQDDEIYRKAERLKQLSMIIADENKQAEMKNDAGFGTGSRAEIMQPKGNHKQRHSFFLPNEEQGIVDIVATAEKLEYDLNALIESKNVLVTSTSQEINRLRDVIRKLQKKK